MKAGVYKNEPVEDIPGFEQIETTAKRRYDRVMLETETTSHFNKYRRLPTGWISTTTSLMRAIQILFVEHRQGGNIFVISLADCLSSNVYSAPKLITSLPTLNANRFTIELKSKSPNEFLIWGKVQEQAIVGCISASALECPSLGIICPTLSSLTGWSKEWKAMWDKAPIRKVGDDAMDAAIKLSAAFRCNNQEFLARKFLSLEFRLDSSTMDESRFLEMIRKQPSPNPRAEYNNFLSLQQDVLRLLSELDGHMRQHPHAVPPKANLDAVSSLLRALGLVIQLALHD